MSNKSKEPWFIWLSIPAFILLHFDTAMRILIFKRYDKISTEAEKSNTSWDQTFLWSKYIFTISIHLFGFIAAPIFLLEWISYFVYQNFGRNLDNVLAILGSLLMYFIGVFLTSRLYRWRQKHIPLLINKRTS